MLQPPESCTPDDISRLAIRLSFSAADASGKSGKQGSLQLSPAFSFAQSSPLVAAPTNLVSIDSVHGIKAKDAPTTLGDAS